MDKRTVQAKGKKMLLPFNTNLLNPSRKRIRAHLGWLNLLPNPCKLTSQGCSFRRLHFPCLFNVLALEEGNKCLTHFIFLPFKVRIVCVCVCIYRSFIFLIKSPFGFSFLLLI
ncbi:hypothetical protein V8G54_023823 [Vigna mungo]|uniref:Transmembrane protein n=1 Tax=Vigna mungo TaxID=3915 RepID=A0AAQ3RQP8_VIGMU